MVFIKDVSSNADAGTASKWGGNDINFLDDYFDDVDITPKVGKINTRTYFRSGKFEWRDSDNSASYIVVAGNLSANRNLNLPVLTADDTFTFKGIDNNFTVMQTIRKTSQHDMLTLHRDSSTVGDINELNFDFDDSAASQQPYAAVRAEITANTAGSHSARLIFRVTNAGSELSNAQIEPQGTMFIKPISTEATALKLYRQRNTVGDQTELFFEALDSASNETRYAHINSEIVDATDGSEDGKLEIATRENGTVSDSMVINNTGATEILISSTQANALDLNRNINTNGSGCVQRWLLRDSASNATQYGAISTQIVSNTDTAETGKMILRVINAAAMVDMLVINPDGNIDFGTNLRLRTRDTLLTAQRTFDWFDIGTVGGANPRVHVQTHDFYEIEDEFFSSQLSDGTITSNMIGVLKWVTVSPVGTGAPVRIAPTSNHPGIIQLGTSAASGDNDVLMLEAAVGNACMIPTDTERFAWIVRIPTITTVVVRIGLMQDISAASGGTAGAYFEFDSAADADSWRTVTRQASTSTTNTSAGANAVANNWMLLEAVRLSGGNWEFYINNTLAFTHSANLPTTACNIGCIVQTATTAARTLDIDYFKLRTVKFGQRWT